MMAIDWVDSSIQLHVILKLSRLLLALECFKQASICMLTPLENGLQGRPFLRVFNCFLKVFNIVKGNYTLNGIVALLMLVDEERDHLACVSFIHHILSRTHLSRYRVAFTAANVLPPVN